jgi:hypothetical protein
MSKIATRYIAALVLAGMSVLPGIASAQGAGGSYTGNSPHDMDSYSGQQVQWNGNQGYWYDKNHTRHTMNYDAARSYAQQQDHQWYQNHKSESRSDFMRDWKGHFAKRNAQQNQGG